MKSKILILLTFSILSNFTLSAHEGGHGHPLKVWMINEVPIAAEFVKYENEKVYLLNAEHELNIYDLSVFSQKEQEWILETTQKLSALDQVTTTSGGISAISNLNTFGFLLGALIAFFSLFLYISKRRKFYLALEILGSIMIVLIACNKNDDDSDIDPNPTITTSVPANDVKFLTSIFGQFAGVNTNSDGEWFYISSNGLPEHNMMVGITNWQQQVPIDQNYTGNNSWAIPIQPELSDNPLSTQTNLLKGALAISVNGIPIFNPLNNRGEDANEIGELDQWGRHCGRADDYHYHIPPVHLQSMVGAGNPIAYAVDGFPVYGETTEELDEYLGRFNTDSSYQYHTIQEYPYFIAGMRGKVTLDPTTTAPENQVIP
ncbi:MAG: YHYH protein [Bacteroidota bacterium]